MEDDIILCLKALQGWQESLTRKSWLDPQAIEHQIIRYLFGEIHYNIYIYIVGIVM